MSEKEVRALVEREVAQAVQAVSENLVQAARELREELRGKAYNSVEECPAWSRAAVAWAVESGYIQGSGNGNLNLDDSKVWALQVNYNMMKARRAGADGAIGPQE